MSNLSREGGKKDSHVIIHICLQNLNLASWIAPIDGGLHNGTNTEVFSQGCKKHPKNLMSSKMLIKNGRTAFCHGMDLQTHSGGATGGKNVIIAFTYKVEGHAVYWVPMLLFDAAYKANPLVGLLCASVYG